VTIVAGAVFIPGALAVHDTGLFQLDGDASTALNTTGAPAANDDWDRVCHQVTGSAACGTTPNTTGATAVAWTGDCPKGQSGIGCNNTNATIFTGGGSKDPIDISSWAWKDGAGGLPDKDNLVHAFAARYSVAPSTTCPAGTAPTCDVVYFGSDRFDNSGDAQQGFWFLQNKVALGSNSIGGGFGFTGVHRNGDLLVISDFSNGGTTSTISVYKWNSAVSGNLQLLQSSSSAECTTVTSPDAFCGIVNPVTVASPWSTDYTDKSGNHSYLQGELYEAGINLSTLGLSGECFSSVVSETRSSTSTTATLKDFVLGNFAVCQPGMTTQASATTASPVLPGAAVHDTATITITGATSPADPTGDVTFFLCPGACTTGGTNIGTGTLNGGSNTSDGSATATSPDVNTAANPLAPGTYCFRAEWPGDSNYAPASHTNSTTECFAVKDTSSITTAQAWVPQDTASVTTAAGTTVSGTVVFSLYASADCSGTALTTFTDSSAPFATNNTTSTTATTVSWRAVFTPSDTNAVAGSTSRCETTTVTLNNNSGP
jgi:hypothetical protein